MTLIKDDIWTIHEDDLRDEEFPLSPSYDRVIRVDDVLRGLEELKKFTSGNKVEEVFKVLYKPKPVKMSDTQVIKMLATCLLRHVRDGSLCTMDCDALEWIRDNWKDEV